MARTPRRDATMVAGLHHHQHGVDRRHLNTGAGMLVGWLASGLSRLTAWAPAVQRRAASAQRPVRRGERWRHKARSEVPQRDGPRLRQALAEWGHTGLSLALETSSRGESSGLVRLARRSRGRALPRVWTGLPRHSRRLADEAANDVLDTAAVWLPLQGTVVCLAERGCAETPRMDHLRPLAWQWRRRRHRRCWSERHGPRPGTLRRLAWAAGEAGCWPQVCMTATGAGPVQRALARHHERPPAWVVVREAPTARKPFAESGWRLDSAAHGCEDHSPGFQRASARMRAAAAWGRRCWVLALTTRSRVAQGVAVGNQGTRRWGDPPWVRGRRDLNIGGNGVKLALSRGDERVTRVSRATGSAPEPAMASNNQDQNHLRRGAAVTCQDAVA